MEEIHITFNVDIYLVRPFVVHKDCVIKVIILNPNIQHSEEYNNEYLREFLLNLINIQTLEELVFIHIEEFNYPDAITDLINNHPSLKSLKFIRVEKINERDLYCYFLSKESAINRFSISHSNFIFDHFPSNIKEIKLDLSIIDEDNMRVLVSIIKKSPNLTHIDLARNTISNKAVEFIVNDLNEQKVLKISGVSDNILFEHPDNMLINETSIDPDLDTSITIDLNFMNMRRSVERMGKLQKEITEEYSKQNSKRKADWEDLDDRENKKKK
ncbi:32086_t:CDS:2 [Gigaspora margarita]|uniref:32086_t:CDS:1 n=1 Tax=Gigaspora margarita TaxID=4874 RepID=A0ABN7VXT3_GIGMA|nr:32086_t:CDS:2 [Gigaspora margarita]